MSRAALLLGCSAFLLTAAAPPPALAPGQATTTDRDSPVRCRVQPQPRDIAASAAVAPVPIRPGKRTRHVPPPVMPAPMPPMMGPPPPPAPIAGVTSQSVVVTGTRVAPYGSAENTERYDGKPVASIQSVAAQPVSTFSVDVDTGAYANVRRMLAEGQAVPPEAVRTEEMINYFRYDYPRPTDASAPFSVTTDVAATPWNPQSRLLRIGLRGYDVDANGRPPANLVFLVDVSGSMDQPNKLPLVKQALTLLADRLTPQDRVSIVVYAGAAGVVLEPTADKRYVTAALDCLSAGGSTAGAQGIEMAYNLARANFRKGGINRIFLATDGDFNVGVSDNKALEELVKKNRDDGITLTTLGFGEGNYNDAMMERIADVGNGNYAYIDSAMEAQKVLDDELSATLFTIAKDVKVQVEFNPAQVKEYRLIGYENRLLKEEDFNNDTVDAGDIGAGHQVTALYEIMPAGAAGWLPERRYPGNRTPASGGTGGELAFVKLRYKLPGQETSKLIQRPIPASLIRTAAPPTGDMAFVTAVAAFGQRLRGDEYLNGYGFRQIGMLAAGQQGYWREEFAKLVRLAEAQKPGAVAEE